MDNLLPKASVVERNHLLSMDVATHALHYGNDLQCYVWGVKGGMCGETQCLAICRRRMLWPSLVDYSTMDILTLQSCGGDTDIYHVHCFERKKLVYYRFCACLSQGQWSWHLHQRDPHRMVHVESRIYVRVVQFLWIKSQDLKRLRGYWKGMWLVTTQYIFE